MDLSVIVLILTGFFALLGFGLIVAAFLISENKLLKINGLTGATGPIDIIDQEFLMKNQSNILHLTSLDGSPNNAINRCAIKSYDEYIAKNNTKNEFYCSTMGTVPLISPPPFNRISVKSLASVPLSLLHSNLNSINHPIQKIYRTRSMKDIISPNHWLGNAMYGDQNIFLVYPYLGSIKDESFIFTLPEIGTLYNIDEKTGNVDIEYISSVYSKIFNKVETKKNISNLHNNQIEPLVEIGSSGSKWLSCDIVDVDALVSTIIWQYQNFDTKKRGSITIPLAKGSPFITIQINNIETTIKFNKIFSLEPLHEDTIYIVHFDKIGTPSIENSSEQKYVIFLPIALTLTKQFDYIIIPRMIGTIRMASFNSADMFNILLTYYQTYPIESTIATKAENVDNGLSWNVDTSFIWTTNNMFSDDKNLSKINTNHSIKLEDKLLMLALPHHNLTNIIFESLSMYHPIIGPYRFVITENNVWNLADAVANYGFEYPPSDNMEIMSKVWKIEISNILNAKPETTINWMKWLGSLATLILIGKSLNEDIDNYQNLLQDELNVIQQRQGIMSPVNTIVYDQTWGGTISNFNLTNCANNFESLKNQKIHYGVETRSYESHVGQFGYLIFAYAVAGYLNPIFINENKETALYFVRNIVNPYEFDDSFPLWRNKDWYFGYSISSGLAPGQIGGKDTYNIAENIMGYYGTYLISQVLKGPSPQTSELLLNWSLGLLASEITALQHYFQFASNNSIIIDPAFVQGTITNRGDAYYSYNLHKTSSSVGNQDYPEKNASMIIPMIKPLTLMSFDYININWANVAKKWLLPAITQNIQHEPLAYATVVLSMNTNSATREDLINIILEHSNVLLPYGSTWSSIIYWVVNQPNVV